MGCQWLQLLSMDHRIEGSSVSFFEIANVIELVGTNYPPLENGPIISIDLAATRETLKNMSWAHVASPFNVLFFRQYRREWISGSRS
jgi:hypothetical protein